MSLTVQTYWRFENSVYCKRNREDVSPGQVKYSAAMLDE